MFHIELKQLVSQQKVRIFIRAEEDEGPFILVSKCWNHATSTMGPAIITPNVQFRTCYATEAREVAEWWHIAAETAEILDGMFLIRDDLKRRILVHQADRTVMMKFVDEESAADNEI